MQSIQSHAQTQQTILYYNQIVLFFFLGRLFKSNKADRLLAYGGFSHAYTSSSSSHIHIHFFILLSNSGGALSFKVTTCPMIMPMPAHPNIKN